MSMFELLNGELHSIIKTIFQTCYMFGLSYNSCSCWQFC